MTQRSPGNTTGRVVISSCSLAKVTAEPAKDTAPTSIVNTIAQRAPSGSLVVWPSSSTATSAAAPPPTPLNSADQLRHLGHLHAPGDGHRDRGADRDGGEDQRDVAPASPSRNTVTTASSGAGGADQVAAAGGPRAS